MKVAHWCTFGPNQCGLYHTAKDMLWGERQAGIDAQMINSGQYKDGEKVKITSGLIKQDGWLRTVHPGWAKDADVFVLHSAIPSNYRNMGKPIVVVCHGRPESSFEMERQKIMGVYTSYYTRARSEKYKAFVTLWPEYMHTLGQLLPQDKLHCVTAPINFVDFSPFGNKFNLGKKQGRPNILVADMWRHDETPFNVIQAVSFFQKHHCPEARIHIVGLQDIQSNHIKVLVKSLDDAGCLGNVAGGVRNMAEIYRSADILVTPHVIATRVVREALACGVTIVAGSGNQYTPYTANPMDTEGYADEINRCWESIKNREVRLANHGIARHSFDACETGKEMKKIFDKILQEKSLVPRSWASEADYVKTQKSKYKRIRKSLDAWDSYYYENLKNRLNVEPGTTALCLGARQGTEVRVLRDLGVVAVGIDLEPGPDNPYTGYGDFRDLKFPDNAFDIVFTNSLDHVKDLSIVLSEIKRVLKSSGRLLVDVGSVSNTANDKWASLFWDSLDPVIREIELNGFKFVANTAIQVDHLAKLTNHLEFVHV